MSKNRDEPPANFNDLARMVFCTYKSRDFSRRDRFVFIEKKSIKSYKNIIISRSTAILFHISTNSLQCNKVLRYMRDF